MEKNNRVLLCFGTRPEAIKMAPLVLALRECDWADPVVCVTGQHREMLDQVLDLFQIKPDYDLKVMSPGQDLSDVTAKVLKGVRDVIKDAKPALTLVHGDTTTCFASALASFNEQVPIGHVEAGLRTGDVAAPFPEEANRTLVTPLCSLHFAPTQKARENLLAENVCSDKISMTGNTGIDALLITKDRLDSFSEEYWIKQFGDTAYRAASDKSRKMVLVTAHRRENFGQGFVDICSAIKKLAAEHKDWEFIFPVHLNPNVQGPVYSTLNDIENIHLLKPMDYLPFVWMMDKCDVCLTDSGGVQEEAPSLAKPVLVMRDVTERPEAVVAGTAKLVGTRIESIISGVGSAINRDGSSSTVNPYGDGKAAERIVRALKNDFSVELTNV